MVYSNFVPVLVPQRTQKNNQKMQLQQEVLLKSTSGRRVVSGFGGTPRPMRRTEIWVSENWGTLCLGSPKGAATWGVYRFSGNDHIPLRAEG